MVRTRLTMSILVSHAGPIFIGTKQRAKETPAKTELNRVRRGQGARTEAAAEEPDDDDNDFEDRLIQDAKVVSPSVAQSPQRAPSPPSAQPPRRTPSPPSAQPPQQAPSPPSAPSPRQTLDDPKVAARADKLSRKFTADLTKEKVFSLYKEALESRSDLKTTYAPSALELLMYYDPVLANNYYDYLSRMSEAFPKLKIKTTDDYSKDVKYLGTFYKRKVEGEGSVADPTQNLRDIAELLQQNANALQPTQLPPRERQPTLTPAESLYQTMKRLIINNSPDSDFRAPRATLVQLIGTNIRLARRFLVSVHYNTDGGRDGMGFPATTTQRVRDLAYIISRGGSTSGRAIDEVIQAATAFTNQFGKGADRHRRLANVWWVLLGDEETRESFDNALPV